MPKRFTAIIQPNKKYREQRQHLLITGFKNIYCSFLTSCLLPHLFVGCISASPAAWPVRSALPVCLLTRVFWDPDDDLDDDPDHQAGSAPGTGGPGGVGDSIHPQGSRCMSPLTRRLGLSSLDSPHCSNASAGLTLQHCTLQQSSLDGTSSSFANSHVGGLESR